jgi:ketosteroid isomerase-like protein
LVTRPAIGLVEQNRNWPGSHDSPADSVAVSVKRTIHGRRHLTARQDGGWSMTAERAVDEAEIRQRIDTLADAVRLMDLERIKPIYAPDLLSFDIVPPLLHRGAQAKWKNWDDVFAAYQRPLDYEVRDLSVTVGDDLAFTHSLNRISGLLNSGNRSDYWVRWTTCFQKIGGNWLIAHDHVSVPLDVRSGRALMHLQPG